MKVAKTAQLKLTCTFFLLAQSMAANASMSQGKFKRDLGTCVFLDSLAGAPHLITGFAHAVSCTHMYLACHIN